MGLTRNFHGKKRGGAEFFFCGLKGAPKKFAINIFSSGPPYKCLWMVSNTMPAQVVTPHPDTTWKYGANGPWGKWSRSKIFLLYMYYATLYVLTLELNI